MDSIESHSQNGEGNQSPRLNLLLGTKGALLPQTYVAFSVLKNQWQQAANEKT